ncbi:olfactory receptor 1D5-like isoform X1 [Brienomyrus brachyistius]|uniref:olfactory receptor 1D5-like isoform X1 n=1 Tax=Brienomyrus brachyistius TaxID=42636 RepID=UPI0020B2DA88|nr:olfactory receptor 1D5-like isoform X1 [Brienomyrus brachyistius]XP_048837813.1 olfactory receptor 1D5-like isoform X1 [Brienomyrus brachyistius]XP_048837814.1 olfactory receptor 1D5-like isoform X1 [Brienomyrus brachyistius]XP_048837815.1 olfactory receptor 1D5-like isoform X1 [Brienomyrus brachyistius]XP_048837816.1 olfactory receptor 1D5-like isoform X1 [Brienomyrus brachyistius]
MGTMSTLPLEDLPNSTVFTLSGINASRESRYVFFCITFLYYLVIIAVNLIIIVTVALRKPLHEPMYVFLCNLCLNGLYGTLGFYPKFLYDLLSDVHEISRSGCFVQVFVIYSAVLCDFSTLTVMSYDRSVAICRPLEYHTVMTGGTVFKLIVFSWFLPISIMFLTLVLSSGVTLCGSHIEKLYCENWAVVKMTCTSNLAINVLGYLVIVTYFGHVMFILFSYVKLIKTSLKSAANRSKFIQTCTPHLLSLINVTVASLFDMMYSRYGSRDFPQGLRHFLALEFLIVPPLLNPLIYGLKLSKVRNEVLKHVICYIVKF